jgi:hypothetical protein
MASTIPQSLLDDIFEGRIDIDTDTFKVMLLTSAYTPNILHDRRDDLTNEVSGTGYTAGGATVTCSVARDDGNRRVEITCGSASWASSTITARYAAYYKSRGGAASADELLLVNDFGSDVISTGGTFSLAASTIRAQNP